jgi:hypothetical protein
VQVTLRPALTAESCRNFLTLSGRQSDLITDNRLLYSGFMPVISIRVVTVAILALSIAVLNGCSLFGGEPDDPMDYLREQVRMTVLDENRADSMITTVDQIDDMMVEIADVLVGAARRERSLFRDYDSTQQDFETLFENSYRERKNLQKAILALHLDFKSQASADEWRVLLPAQVKAISERTESLVLAAFAETR